MDKKNKHALQVSALCNGTVIDHIPADKLFAALLDQKALSKGEIEGLKALVARLDEEA